VRWQLTEAGQHVVEGLLRQLVAGGGAQGGPRHLGERANAAGQGERHPVTQRAGEEQLPLVFGTPDVDEPGTQPLDPQHGLEDVDQHDLRPAGRRPGAFRRASLVERAHPDPLPGVRRPDPYSASE
jgi:hypothetical protein